jgi:trigger factor
MTSIRVEDISDVRKKVFFEIPAEHVNERLEANYRDMKKTVQIKGFRRGKVPLDLLKMYFKSQVEAEVSSKIIEDTFQPGLDEKNLTLVSVVDLTPDPLSSGKPFTFCAEIDVAPSITPTGYKGISLEKNLRPITDEEVSKTLETLRERYAKLAPPQEARGARKGDHVVIDVDAMRDGQPVKEITLKDYPMEVGKALFIRDLDEKLLEAREGDEIRFSIPAPPYVKAPEGASATVDLTVRLKELKERILPEPDDAFAKDLGRHETLDELKAEIRRNLERRAEVTAEEEMNRRIVDVLIEKHPFEVPESLVQGQIDVILSQARQRLIGMGQSTDMLDAADPTRRETLRPTAERHVRAALILKALARREGIEVTDSDMDEEVKIRAEALGWSVDHLKDELERHNMWEDLRGTVMEKKVMDFIRSNAQITEAPSPDKVDSEQGE